MKFINYIKNISDIDVYGLISLSIFVTFFVVMIIMVFAMKRQTINELKNIPLN